MQKKECGHYFLQPFFRNSARVQTKTPPIRILNTDQLQNSPALRRSIKQGLVILCIPFTLVFPFSLVLLIGLVKERKKNKSLLESSQELYAEFNECYVNLVTSKEKNEKFKSLNGKLETAQQTSQERSSHLADKSQLLELAYSELEKTLAI